MDDDDFTFPTVAAARGPTALEGQLGRNDDPVLVPHLHQLSLPSLAGASPLWPFAGSIPKTTSPPVTAADDEQPPGPASGSTSGRAERSAVAEEEEDEEGHRVATDEDRMDLLWESTTTTTRLTATAPAPDSRSVAGHAGPPPPPPLDDDKQRAAALADAERMDKLWESFNEDLVLRQRHHRGRARARRAKSAADHPGISVKVSRADLAGDDQWYFCNYSPSSVSGADESVSDQETSASSPAERRGYGCAPTMLRASSRAGGAGQFCAGAATSPRGRRRGRGAAVGWALLLRLFRRLFAVEKTAPSSSRSHSSLYVP